MTRQEMELRRLEAGGLIKNGAILSEVAKKAGVSRTTVYRWYYAIREKKSLKARKATGRPPLLTEGQFEEVRVMCRREGWTYRTLAEEIHDKFGVRYDIAHICRILHRMGMTRKYSTAG